jgi:hypothetical protein
MAIQLNCPSCQRAYTLDDALTGKTMRCKQCRELFAVGAPGQMAIATADNDAIPKNAVRAEVPARRAASTATRPERQSNAGSNPTRSESPTGSGSAWPWVLMFGGALLVLLTCAGGSTALLVYLALSDDKAADSRKAASNQQADSGKAADSTKTDDKQKAADSGKTNPGKGPDSARVPPGDKTPDKVDGKQGSDKPTKPQDSSLRNSFVQLKAGMTRVEVEGILGNADRQLTMKPNPEERPQLNYNLGVATCLIWVKGDTRVEVGLLPDNKVYSAAGKFGDDPLMYVFPPRPGGR